MIQLEDAYEKKKVESQAKEVWLPCEAGVGISTPIERDFGVEIKDQLDQEIARMFYTRGLTFNLARNPHYFPANNKIDGYVPPGYWSHLGLHGKKKGGTIVSDGWSDPTRKPLINFMGTSGYGHLFLKVVNCFGKVKDRFFITEFMKEFINEIGHENVVQIITKNAANCKALPHIYWTPCVVHTLNLVLKNICSPRNVETNELTYEQCSWIKEVHEEAFAIKNFTMNHNIRLSIFTKFAPLRLLSVADTRFASIIVMLKRLKLIKRGFQAMVISKEWSSYRLDDTEKANSVKEYILNDDWRDKVAYILSFTRTIYEMIRACDTGKSCLHLVYEMWDSMSEKMKIEIYKKEKRLSSQISFFYDVVYHILVARWAKNNTLLHCLAHSLHPRYYSDAWLMEDSTRFSPHRNGEISQERIECFRRLFPKDDEYAMFSMKSGHFEDLTNISKMATMEPNNWWLKRNKLTTSRAQDLVYIHNNLRLLSMTPKDDVKTWDVGGDAFDSMKDVGFLEVVDLSLDEPDF
uniref:DUF659 domain-containing protein n=1 Tax=Lactuca sativa TaxID=4236 RepID=A0A9R1VKY7_LACSA|nr:hypothetical protein LSAT_V11C500252780 [Lactuca sativa]